MTSNYFDSSDPSRPIGLKVEEKTFWVSNQALALYSPVFKAMFFGDFTEAKNKIVDLPDKKADDILELLLCLFPTAPEMKEVDSDNVNILLALADEYQIDFLKRKCRKFLTEKIRPIQGKHDDLWFVLRLASKYDLHDIMEECAMKCAAYTLSEALILMADLPPLAVAFVALYAWKAVTTGAHVAGVEQAVYQYCGNCGNQSFYTCTNCKQKYCAACSTRTCRSVKMESMEQLIKNMKDKGN